MLTTVLPIAAAANAALLAAALAYRALRKRARAGLYAAAFLMGAAAAITLITLDHAGSPLNPRLAVFAEGALTLAAGPLFLLFVAALLVVRLPPAWIWFLPLLAFGAGSALFPAQLLHAFTIERLVLVQMAFTLGAAFLAWRHQPTGRRSGHARTLAIAAIGSLAALHIAQFVRMAWSDVDALINIVPLVGGAAFLAATAAVYFGGRLSALDPVMEVPAAADDRAHALADKLDEALKGGLLRDADLTIARAATVAGVTSDQLSQALAATRGMTFSEYLQCLRVAEAKRLLIDPREARTSMEAIGLLVGFGSRSAFYKAFNDQVGLSPAAYRREEGVQNLDSGQ